MYKIGNRLIEIHSDVMKNLLKWNTAPLQNDRDLDYAFGLSVFLSLVPMERIAAGEIDQNAFAFILGSFLSLQIYLEL